MKKYLLICFCLFYNYSKAQIDTQWVNRFCCFDTIAPHSFSYPLGVEYKFDSLFVCYFEDDTLKLKIINGLLNTDLQNYFYAPDSILPAFNYGGNFVSCFDGFLTSYTSYVNGNYKLNLMRINEQFGVDSISLDAIQIGSEKPTKFLKVDSQNFYLAYLTDSLHLLKIDLSAWLITEIAYPKGNTTELYPEMYLDSLGALVVVSRRLLGVNLYQPEFRRIDLSNGMLVNSFSMPNLGYTHTCFSTGDSIYVAWNVNANGYVFFTAVNIHNLGQLLTTGTGAYDFYSVINFSKDKFTGNFYLQTYENLIRINSDRSIEYIRNIIPGSLALYNQSPLLFDQNDNPIIFKSYINNTIANEDLLIQRFDRNTGLPIDSFVYNDPRNTPDIAITQFKDWGNQIMVMFANDYDDNVVLQEETQLNLIRFNSLANDIQHIKKSVCKIYPNPTTGKIVFVGDLPDRVEVYSSLGMKIKNLSLINSNEIDLKNFPAGIYFLKSFLSDEFVSTYRIVKID